jgi:hypothetical protein
LSLLFIVTVLLLAAVAYIIFRRQQESAAYRAEHRSRPDAQPGLVDSAHDEEDAGRRSAEDVTRADGD